ncbi:hypothetical protein GGF46_001307 [Coemansia sp. RSA 552]|nr:hypothetical protein GGF46_001307 [Coemansia sp. RSA 552]
MTIQLTRDLLRAFLGNAESKSQQTLALGKLSSFAFAGTAYLWLVPFHVNHPMRRVLGLRTAFILISAASGSGEASLRRVRSIPSGTEPLATWTSLTAADAVGSWAQYEFEWGVQRLAALDRDKARVLTAQYAQILPELRSDDDVPLLPMLVFTREIEQLGSRPPFYLAMFSPSSPLMFANVVAVKSCGQAEKDVLLLEQGRDGNGVSMQHWAEYDLLGSAAQAAFGSDRTEPVTRARAGSGDKADSDGDDDVDSVYSFRVSGPVSYVVLHGIWTSESRHGDCYASPQPAPLPSAQWILELVSVPLPEDPDASMALRSLYMEIMRLETWCECWMAGEKWEHSGQDGAKDRPGMHRWQGASVVNRDHSGADTTETLPDEAGMEVESANTIEHHRIAFGRKIDEFIDASIYDTRGSTAVGRLGRARDIHSPEGFPVREDLDFAERLWNLAHYAHDGSDLSEAVAAVAEGLETRKLQPYIHRSNASPLALVIRQALQMAQAKTLVDAEAEKERLSANLDLWIDEQPLDPFVHIGLHKLRADFWFYFVTGRLATPHQMEPFLDMDKEPVQLIARFWLLLRVLEAWWLLRQAVPGIPRQFACQIIAALLESFASTLESIDRDNDTDGDDGEGKLKDQPQYGDCLKISAFLPVYSTEVQELVDIIANGFDPARYTVTAADKLPAVDADQTADRARFSVLQFMRTPELVDQCFSLDNVHDAFAADVSDAGPLDEEYTVFEARHL